MALYLRGRDDGRLRPKRTPGASGYAAQAQESGAGLQRAAYAGPKRTRPKRACPKRTGPKRARHRRARRYGSAAKTLSGSDIS